MISVCNYPRSLASPMFICFPTFNLVDMFTVAQWLSLGTFLCSFCCSWAYKVKLPNFSFPIFINRRENCHCDIQFDNFPLFFSYFSLSFGTILKNKLLKTNRISFTLWFCHWIRESIFRPHIFLFVILHDFRILHPKRKPFVIPS